MKKAILFILCFSNTILNSQEWAPVGANWYYTAPYSGKCINIESVKDTIIDENKSRLIEIRYCLDNHLISREIIQQKGDSLLYLNDGKFYLFYNFSAKVGDTVKVHENPFTPTKGFLHSGYPETLDRFGYKIADYDSINVSGQWLRTQQVDNLYNFSLWSISIYDPSIIERIGGSCYFFGRNAGIIPEEFVGQLRCYSDDSISYKDPNWNYECDYNLLADIQARFSEPKIHLYPNPFKSEINIEIQGQEDYSVTLYDLCGKMVYRSGCRGATKLGGELTSGLYVLEIESLDQHQYYKIIKRY